MKSINCKELGGSDCSFIAKGETNDEVIQNLYAHAQEVHSDKLSSMSEDDKEKMNKKINDLLTSQNQQADDGGE